VSRRKKESTARICVRLYMEAHGFDSMDDFNADVYDGEEKELAKVPDDKLAQVWVTIKDNDPKAPEDVLDRALEQGLLR
jgi:hypothetical protein